MIAGCPGIVPEVGLDIMYARRSVNVRLTPTPFLYRGQEPFPVIREFFELTRGVKDNPKYQYPHCQDFPVEVPPGTLPNGDGFRVHSERHRIYSLYRVGITRHIQFPFWT